MYCIVLYEHFKSLYSVKYDPHNLRIDPNITYRNIFENEGYTYEDLDREISMIKLEYAVFPKKKMAKAVD